MNARLQSRSDPGPEALWARLAWLVSSLTDKAEAMRTRMEAALFAVAAALRHMPGWGKDPYPPEPQPSPRDAGLNVS